MGILIKLLKNDGGFRAMEYAEMLEDKRMVECFFCKRHLRFGADVYEGSRLPDWGITICHHCRRVDHYGIVPAHHPHLIAHLRERGIEPRKNAMGWICWPEVQHPCSPAEAAS